MTPRVEVWQGHGGQWRWRYLQPVADGRMVQFPSNRHYQSRDEALRTAMTAYPGLPLWEPTITVPAPRRRVARRVGLAVLLGGLLLTALTALVTAGGLALALALLAARRRRRRRPTPMTLPSCTKTR
ncbi:MAG TPA: hypothetical protein VE776_05465 [Actinomycetota bacterium]|nr:hypothetical protein [Actinomycetota bacterium]